jgi:hypothetical protein
MLQYVRRENERVFWSSMAQPGWSGMLQKRCTEGAKEFLGLGHTFLDGFEVENLLQ